MAPTYKLQYFNVTGLGEPIRYLFAYGKLAFDDVRIEFPEFEKIKPTTPFGKLPVVEVDGKTIHQSAAICRYLGKLVGLAGKTDWDQLQADILVDTLTDFRQNYTTWFREKDEANKAKLLEDIMNVHNPFYLGKFEELAVANKGYFVNGQLSWADVFFVAIVELLDNITKTSLLDNYPTLKVLRENIQNLPGIKEYRDTRPKTAM